MTQPGIEPRSPGTIDEHSTHKANENKLSHIVIVTSTKLT